MNDFKGKKIELLISQLKDSEEIDLRCNALEELAGNPEDHERIVPAIIDALNDDNWLVRSEAANTLRVLGDKALSAIPALKNSILEPRNKSKRGIFYSAIQTLEKIQTDGPISKPVEAETIVSSQPEEKLPEVVEEPSVAIVETPEPESQPEDTKELDILEEKEAIEEDVEEFVEDAVEDALEDAVEEITDEEFDDDVLEDIAEEIAEEVAEDVTEGLTPEPQKDSAEEVVEEAIEESLEDAIEDSIEDAVEDVVTEPIAEDALEEVAEDIAEEIVEDITETTSVEETPTIPTEPIEAVPEVKEPAIETEPIAETPQVEEEPIQKELTTRKISKTIMKIILVGEGPVGKTSLRRRYVDDDYTHEYNEVFGADITSKQINIRGEDFVYQFWDVATGDHSYFSSEIFFRGTNSVLLIFDVNNRESFINITNLINEIIKIEGKDLIFFLVGNKVDLRKNQEIECVTKPEGFELAERLSQEFGIKIPYIETSTATGEGIDDLFKTVIDEVSALYFLRKEE